MKEFTVFPKVYDRKYLKEHDHIIFKNRELVIERDGTGDNVMLRFKIGDGIRPYRDLQYISSMYALYPSVCLFDGDYENCFTLSFEEKSE